MYNSSGARLGRDDIRAYDPGQTVGCGVDLARNATVRSGTTSLRTCRDGFFRCWGCMTQRWKPTFWGRSSGRRATRRTWACGGYLDWVVRLTTWALGHHGSYKSLVSESRDSDCTPRFQLSITTSSNTTCIAISHPGMSSPVPLCRTRSGNSDALWLSLSILVGLRWFL